MRIGRGGLETHSEDGSETGTMEEGEGKHKSTTGISASLLKLQE